MGSSSLTPVSPLQASATRKRGSRGRRPTSASTGRWATRPSRSSTPRQGRTSWAVRPACVSTPCTVAGCVCTARYRPLPPQRPPDAPRGPHSHSPAFRASSSLRVWPGSPQWGLLRSSSRPAPASPREVSAWPHPEEGEPGLLQPLEGSGPVSCWRRSPFPDKFSSGGRAFSWFPFVGGAGVCYEAGGVLSVAVWTEAPAFGPWSYRTGAWAGGLAPHLFSRSAPTRVRQPRGQCLRVLPRDTVASRVLGGKWLRTPTLE